MMEKGFLAAFLGKRLGVWLLLAFLGGASGITFAAEIRDIRISTSDSGTRVVIDLSAPVKHKAFVLDDPGRVVLDVAKTTLKTPLPAVTGPITELRSGKLPNGGLRLVFEVKGPVTLSSSTLAASGDAGQRLVLDISTP